MDGHWSLFVFCLLFFFSMIYGYLGSSIYSFIQHRNIQSYVYCVLVCMFGLQSRMRLGYAFGDEPLFVFEYAYCFQKSDSQMPCLYAVITDDIFEYVCAECMFVLLPPDFFSVTKSPYDLRAAPVCVCSSYIQPDI